MNYLLILCLLVSFFSCLFSVRWWIRRAHRAGLVAKDVHKKNRQVANLGGIPVVMSFLLGVLLYVGIRTFVFEMDEGSLLILGVVASVLIITVIGIIDDILGWKLGLKQWQKPLLCLFAALPIMMIKAGNPVMDLPIIGTVNLGIVYTFIVIPIAIAGASNAFNMIAGYNGLEAGMGVIILFVLGLVTWLNGLGLVAMLAGAMVFSLLAFLLFNKYPARIFPGNTLTYAVGGLIAIVAILGNAEKIALVLFLPYFIQFFLKSRGAWRKESFALVLDSGHLDLPHKKVYGIEHLVVWFFKRFKNVHENDVVYGLYFIELVLAVVVILIVM